MKYSPLLSKIIAWLMFIAAAILFLTSCSRHLHYSGTYTVKTVQKQDSASIVTFKRIKGKHLVLSDTLKPGSRIYINVLHDTTGQSKKLNLFKTN